MHTMLKLQTIVGLITLGAELCLEMPSQKLGGTGHIDFWGLDQG